MNFAEPSRRSILSICLIKHVKCCTKRGRRGVAQTPTAARLTAHATFRRYHRVAIVSCQKDSDFGDKLMQRLKVLKG
jgi:hypothetical protein